MDFPRKESSKGTAVVAEDSSLGVTTQHMGRSEVTKKTKKGKLRGRYLHFCGRGSREFIPKLLEKGAKL
jgi:uncharacterized protein affecting Mg2+/Co2+ transport